MQRIVPNLWFDHNAAEAADFYTATFPDSRVLSTEYYPTEGLPDWQSSYAGLPLMVDFEISGVRFMGINAGPEFRPNPSISFFVNLGTITDEGAHARLEAIWAALSEGGRQLMPLQEYPFSPYYGWVEDRYGVNWQLMLSNPGSEPRSPIVPCLTFGQTAQARALTVIEYYTEVFDAGYGTVVPYPPGSGVLEGQTMFGDFQLENQWFAAMDAADFDAGFTCGVSFMVQCDGQAEIDRLWNALSAVPEAEQCGWCVDQFGVSWQIVPSNLGELMAKPDATPKLYAMKKIVIADFG